MEINVNIETNAKELENKLERLKELIKEIREFKIEVKVVKDED